MVGAGDTRSVYIQYVVFGVDAPDLRQVREGEFISSQQLLTHVQWVRKSEFISSQQLLTHVQWERKCASISL